MSPLALASDQAVKEPQDILKRLKYFERIEKVVDEGVNSDEVYIVRPNDLERYIAAQDAHTARPYKIAIGPLEVDMTADTRTLEATIDVYIHIPIIGLMKAAASATDNITNGVESKIGYPSGILKGTVGLKLEMKTTVLHWEFTALGKEYNGQINLFDS